MRYVYGWVHTQVLAQIFILILHSSNRNMALVFIKDFFVVFKLVHLAWHVDNVRHVYLPQPPEQNETKRIGWAHPPH